MDLWKLRLKPKLRSIRSTKVLRVLGSGAVSCKNYKHRVMQVYTSFTMEAGCTRLEGRKKRQLQQEGDRGEAEDHPRRSDFD